MYFPYFRARQFDFETIQATSDLLTEDRIIPIVEPAGAGRPALNLHSAIHEAQTTTITVVNPRHRSFGSHPALRGILDVAATNPNTIFGLVVDFETSNADILNFLDQYEDRRKAFIHRTQRASADELLDIINPETEIAYHIFVDGTVSDGYARKFDQCPRVLIEDAFNRGNVGRNADYPPTVFYSSLYRVYPQRGYSGFGDFVLSEDLDRRGGPMHAFAIHLTRKGESDIWVNHYVSDRVTGPQDPAGKYFEALAKVIAESSREGSSLYRSSAIVEFEQLQGEHRYPGPGKVKCLSMRHHIEFVNSLF